MVLGVRAVAELERDAGAAEHPRAADVERALGALHAEDVQAAEAEFAQGLQALIRKQKHFKFFDYSLDFLREVHVTPIPTPPKTTDRTSFTFNEVTFE